MTSTLVISAGSAINEVIGAAERCRREALSLVGKDPRYSELSGQPAAWCVVTEKGLWSRTFHTASEKDRLQECIEKGHRVILAVGLVAQPGAPLHASKYASVVAVADSQKYSEDKLGDIAVRAKLRAASSLH